MTTYISIKRWSGGDLQQAVGAFAKLFRMPPATASPLVQAIAGGRPWQFERPVTHEQGRTAVEVLRRTGFEADLVSPSVPAPTIEKPPPAKAPAPVAELYFAFHGEGMELFKIQAVNSYLNFLTSGIYHFWAKTNIRRYLLASMSFAGDSFSYHGTGKELIRGYFKLLGYFFVAIVILIVVMIVLEDEIAEAVAKLLGAAAMGLAVPPFMVGAWRYRLSRTSWRGIRFFFDGARADAFALYLKGWVFCALTLGLYLPFFQMEKQEFWRNHSRFGDMKFSFNGNGGDLFRDFIITVALMVPTLSLAWYWYKAKMQSYIWSHTQFAGGTFRFTATPKEWALLNSGNTFLLIITLGLALSWVRVRNQKFFADHLFLSGAKGLEQAVQRMQAAGVMGEDMLDSLDISLDFL